MPTEGISVIICCYNSKNKIKETLLHLTRQEINSKISVEVLLIDNGSTDNTQAFSELCWKEANGPFEFKVILEPKEGLKYAKQRGIHSAKYNYLVFCDDDNWLGSNYLQETYNIFSSDKLVGIIGGCGKPIFETLEPWWFKSFYQSYAIGEQAKINSKVNTVYGAGMAVRKDYFFKTSDKFGPLLLSGRKKNVLTSGEDSEMCYRMILNGYNVFYSNALSFSHYLPAERLTWKYVKKLHRGFSKSYVILNAYELALNFDKIGKFYWLKQALLNLGRALKYSVIYLPKLINDEGSVEKIRLRNWWIVGIDFLRINFRFNSIIEKH